MKKYGVDNPMKTLEVQEKVKQTCIKLYGVDNVFKSEKFQSKADETMLKKYGVKNSAQCKALKLKQEDTCNKRYGNRYYCLIDKCKKANGATISKINQNFSNLLFKNNIENKLEFNIEKYSYDIEILNTNILLEINPTYTHNSTKHCWFNNHSKKILDKNYHFNKTLNAKENGYRCIHIWDWDDKNKIIDMLKNKEIIYAKNCKIKEISREDIIDFEMKYHLQGYCNNQKIKIGLFYLDNLVEIMTFGKPRYNKNYEYELIRLCSHSNYKIIGGATKLFKYFIKTYNPKIIISYCDNSKFSGKVYEKLGFVLQDFGKPSKHWYNPKIKQHITDNLLRQRGFDQLFNTNYGKGTSNKELMIQNGFVEIYDSGQLTYIWKNKT